MNASYDSISSKHNLLSQNLNDGSFHNESFVRDPSNVSTNDIKFPKILESNDEVQEQTLVQVEFVNDKLLRTARRSELASKNTCLTRRWQMALSIGLVLLVLGAGCGGLAYWITSRKAITQPYLLYGESCYMNSRSCDATRMLWCPNGVCLCTGDFQWNTTIQNCTCGQYQIWNGIKCQNYGYYGDPCNSVPCHPTLSCDTVINQTYTTDQDICVCDNVTYLDTSGGPTNGDCIPRLSYGVSCKTEFDCQDWLGLICSGTSPNQECVCGSTDYWNGSICVNNALGWEPCSVAIPCDTTRGLTCVANICECDQYSYWDNVTTLWCQTKKTYAEPCNYDFQCNTTVNLSCPTVGTGCNCYATSYSYMCDCQSGNFWDGQRCIEKHTFNGTCPGSYACTSNLECYLGHCICPGNMVWNTTCSCPFGKTWSTTQNLCI